MPALELTVHPAGPAAAKDAPPLLALHGFTQTQASWRPLLGALCERRPLMLADLPGHGTAALVEADLWQSATLLEAACGALRTEGPKGPLDVVGYSLGARVALHLALSQPRSVRRLVLVSGTAGIADAEARRARRRHDERLAADLESSGDVAGFLERWLAAPMFATLGPAAADLPARLSNTAAGLASSLRLCGAGTQEPLWARLGELEAPLLVVTGATDLRYTALGRRMAGAARAATHSVVPGAGHAAHLEQPALVARLIGSWLAAPLRSAVGRAA